MANNGKVGEYKFKQIMLNRNFQVQDVSNNPEYFEKDIDFIITSPTSGQTKTFEVKWDSKINKTGNLYLEKTNVHSKNGIGWWNFCQADVLAYGDSRTGQFYMFNMEELRERFQHLRKIVASCEDDSTGYLVKLEDVQDLYKTLV